jgi:hypothetical protein
LEPHGEQTAGISACADSAIALDRPRPAIAAAAIREQSGELGRDGSAAGEKPRLAAQGIAAVAAIALAAACAALTALAAVAESQEGDGAETGRAAGSTGSRSACGAEIDDTAARGIAAAAACAA